MLLSHWLFTFPTNPTGNLYIPTEILPPFFRLMNEVVQHGWHVPFLKKTTLGTGK
jgi:hypothetical protein